MTNCEDLDCVALDAYIRTQLDQAAETYASQVDMDARLKEALKARTENERDAVATGQLGPGGSSPNGA